MRKHSDQKPVRRIAALTPDRFVFRLSFWAGLVLYMLVTAVMVITELPSLPYVLVLAAWAGLWVLERRPAVWICDRGNRALSVHKRHVFFWSKTGPELHAHSGDTEVTFEPGPWWRASRLWIDGVGYFVVGEGFLYAKQLVDRRAETATTTA